MDVLTLRRCALVSCFLSAGCSTDSDPAAQSAGSSGGASGNVGSGGNSVGGVGASSGASFGGANAGSGGSASNGGAGGVMAGSGGTATTGGSQSRGGTSSDGGSGAPNAGGAAGAGGAVYPAPGQHTGPGVLPPAADSVVFQGHLVYDDTRILRDLGYSGVVNGRIVWTFGDTLVKGGTPFEFAASDSSALGDLADPLKVHDKALRANGYPEEWIPLTAEEEANGGLGRFAEGGTNVVEYAPNKGLVWFLKNDRGGGSDQIIGAGVATVTADENGAVATRTMDRMWESDEPNWGDVGVTYDPTDGKVYVFGHGTPHMNVNGTVYLARAPAARATEIAAYEYWDQATKTWGTTRYGDGRTGTRTYTIDQALFSFAAHGQSNAFWSNHYNTWMFVYGADWPNSDIYVSTAAKLEGPWSSPITIATTCPSGTTCGTLRYCIAPHPEFDASGKTLLVTWTDANVINAVKVTWK